MFFTLEIDGCNFTDFRLRSRHLQQGLADRCIDIISSNTFAAPKPDDKRLERFGSRGNDRHGSNEVRDAVSQKIRPTFVTTQQGNSKPATFIDHHHAWITPFVFDQSLKITNRDTCRHDKNPLPVRGAPRYERIAISLTTAVVQTVEVASELDLKIPPELFSFLPNNPDT